MKTFLFLLLLVAGGYIYYQHIELTNLRRTISNLQSLYGPKETAPAAQKTVRDWKEVAPADLVTATSAVSTEEIRVEDISFSESVDLTGDTAPEGIFVTSSGAAGNTSFIFSEDRAGALVSLFMKDEKGVKQIVSLSEGVSATQSVSYRLLPEEHGYYVLEKRNTSTTPTPNVVCTLSAYSWNALSGLFEPSARLNTTYRESVCK